MPLKIFNSLDRKVETFRVVDEPITMYVCGITPYDTTHLGHAFTYTVADILLRYLIFQGYSVDYVQNVTDVDDDILKKADEVGRNWLALGNRWTAHFVEDMIRLNVLPPDHFPRATDVIREIIDWVGKLIEAGKAYVVEGNVYYEVDSWPDFGKLSGLSRDEMLPIANERGNNPDDPFKRDPLDFVLWQVSKTDEPGWESPWSKGRPGWHIECSTMSGHFLGEGLDVHLGGADLLFPHHECEIAQMEPVTGKKPFVRYWMHVAMVHHEGAKMSKSLGNLIMVRDLLEDFSSDEIRFYLASHHYREAWSFSRQDIKTAAGWVGEINRAVGLAMQEGEVMTFNDLEQEFLRAMDSDLDTPKALRVLREFSQEISTAWAHGQDVHEAQKRLRELSALLGARIGETGPDMRVLGGWQDHLTRFPVSS